MERNYPKYSIIQFRNITQLDQIIFLTNEKNSMVGTIVFQSVSETLHVEGNYVSMSDFNVKKISRYMQTMSLKIKNLFLSLTLKGTQPVVNKELFDNTIRSMKLLSSAGH